MHLNPNKPEEKVEALEIIMNKASSSCNSTLRVKREQLRYKSRSSKVPRDVWRERAFAEDGEHVFESVRVLRVLL